MRRASATPACIGPAALTHCSPGSGCFPSTALALGLFSFARARRGFRLESVHPGHSVEEIRDNTGFEFDCPARVPATPAPDASTLAAIRNRIRGDIAETYPHFAATLAAA